MENYNLDKDITVFYVTADSFPAGVIAAHSKLRALLPSEKGRHFFGLSRPENGSDIVYRAAVEEVTAGEGEALGCKTLVIKKGNYTSIFIPGAMQHIEKIKEAFDVLLSDPRIDHNGGYCVEMYVGGTDVRCMVRLRD
jgi:hypothetical protein